MKATRGFPGAFPSALHLRERKVLVAMRRFGGPTASKVLFTAFSKAGRGCSLHHFPSAQLAKNETDVPEIDAFLSARASNMYYANRCGVLDTFGNRSDDRPCGLSSQVKARMPFLLEDELERE